MFQTGLIALLSIVVLATAQRCHLNDADHQRLLAVFADGIKSNDLQSIYYSSLSLTKLSLSENEKTTICNQLPAVYSASKLNEFEKNFYLIGGHNHLQCKTPVQSSVLTAVKASLTKDASNIQELYYNYFANKYVGNAVDDSTKTKIATRVHSILTTDDSLTNIGYALNIGAELGAKAATLKKWADTTIAQADEVDNTLLQFEGGLSLTALIINGLLKYSKATQAKAPLTEAQVQKFSAYFLSRRTVQQAKGAAVLLEVLDTIATEHKTSAICAEFMANGIVQPDAPIAYVKLVDVLNRSLKPAATTLHASVVSKADRSILASKLPLVSKSSDNTVQELDLKAAKLTSGLYNVELTIDSIKQTLPIKVLSKVVVQNVEIGIGESDSSSADQKHTVVHPQKVPTVLSADQQQKITLKVSIVDELTKKPVTVHQSFVLFRDIESKKEIIFIAEQDASKAYKFSLDVGAHSAFFLHSSGVYATELIVGDAMIANSFRWHLADIELKFQERPDKPASNSSFSRKPRPEIVHQFRQPEKRPPRFVSDLFTVLTAAPLLILFLLWAKIGVNVSSFSITISSIGFFGSFGSILALFAMFWYQYNMFETLRLLIPLLIVTFIFGNRFLRSVARREHTKAE